MSKKRNNEIERLVGVINCLKSAPLIDGMFMLREKPPVKLDPDVRDHLMQDVEQQLRELIRAELAEGVRRGEFVRYPNGKYVLAEKALRVIDGGAHQRGG
jgi:hypothetical protein